MNRLAGFGCDVLALVCLAVFVTLESRLAPSIFPDEMMQIAIICLCACVGAGIFVTIRTQKWEGWSNKLVGSVLLLPLIIHAVGAGITANVGAMHDKDKEVGNNLARIEALQKQVDSLYTDKKIMQAYNKVTAAKEITYQIDQLTKQITELQTSQKATIDEKYSGYGGVVINLLGASFAIVALFLKIVFAVCAQRYYAAANAGRVQYAGEQDDTQQAEYEHEPSRAEIRAEERLSKQAGKEQQKNRKNENLSIVALAGHIIQENIQTRDEAREAYKDEYTYGHVDKAWKQAQEQRKAC